MAGETISLIILSAFAFFLAYQFFSLPLFKFKRRSFVRGRAIWTAEDIAVYDGRRRKEILIAVGGRVYDVTERGYFMYGPGRKGVLREKL